MLKFCLFAKIATIYTRTSLSQLQSYILLCPTSQILQNIILVSLVPTFKKSAVIRALYGDYNRKSLQDLVVVTTPKSSVQYKIKGITERHSYCAINTQTSSDVNTVVHGSSFDRVGIKQKSSLHSLINCIYLFFN